MTIASDNPFPSLLIVEGTAPSAPAASRQRLYFDSTTHLLKAINSGGTARTIESGGELDYVEFTGSNNVTATTEGTSSAIVTGTSISLDGSTSVVVEYFCPQSKPASVASAQLIYVLYDGGTVLGQFGIQTSPAATANYTPVLLRRRLATPSAASHQYIVKGYVTSGTGVVAGGAGGSGVNVPGYIRVTRV